MDQQKNLILAIVVSCAILFGFQFFFAPKTQAPQPAPVATEQSPSGSAPQAGGTPAPIPPGGPAAGVATAGAPPSAAPREKVLGQTPRVAIDTPRLKGSINLVGGRVDDLTLLDYRETVET